MKANNSPIILTEDMLYGKGLHKKCYIHPFNNNLCIKFAYNRGGQEDINREISYIKILNKRKKNYSILPKYYGRIETNLGTGYIFELIKNFDNTECKTLQDFLSDRKLLSENFETILKLLKTLKRDLFDNEIITLDLFAHNILLQKVNKQTYQIRIVNDMGSAVLIPLEYYFHYFAKAKIQRVWNRFVESLNRKYPSILIDKITSEIK